jgi:DNA-binding transcriptional LysR family regulator
VQLLADVDEAESAAGSLGVQPRGRLRLTVPIHFGPSELRPIIQGFIERYREISVEVVATNQRMDLIEDGIDLAVRIAARALEPSLIARRLATSRLVACASPAYLKRHGVPAQPADLKNHQRLTTTLFKLDQGWTFRRAGKSETVKLPATLQSNNNELLCEAAADGFGVTVQPTINVWRGLAAGRLTTILDKWSLGELGIFVVYPSRRFLPAKTRLFIDFLTARFPGGPQHDVWIERAHSS